MFQKIIIIGDLGRDPEMRYTPAGQPVTNFSVATSNKYTKSDGEEVKETVWFRISVWGGRAESCYKYLAQGSRVMVEGRVKCHVYQKNDKTWDATLEVNASDVKFLDKLDKRGGKKDEEEEEYEDIPGFAR